MLTACLILSLIAVVGFFIFLFSIKNKEDRKIKEFLRELPNGVHFVDNLYLDPDRSISWDPKMAYFKICLKGKELLLRNTFFEDSNDEKGAILIQAGQVQKVILPKGWLHERLQGHTRPKSA